jgi:thiamine-monophosphate kinase
MVNNGEIKKKTEISDIGKNALTAKLLSQLNSRLSSTLIYGQEGEFVWENSHSLFLEGIDFDLVYMPLKYLGYKSLIMSIGPLYSNLFFPDNISIRLGLSGRFSVEDVEELWSGIVAGIEEHQISNVSLELVPSMTGLTLSLSSQGKQRKSSFVQKPAPSSGDLICLSGNVGAALMGLHLLEREKALFNSSSAQPDLTNYKFILKAYLNPEINTSLLKEFENNGIVPTSGEFLSKGLADAVKMICHNTGFGAKIFLEKIPVATQTSAMAEELNLDPVTAALNGGNDVQFIFTIPVSQYEVLKKEFPQLDIIGHLCSPEIGAVLITPDGLSLELKAQAWSK